MRTRKEIEESRKEVVAHYGMATTIDRTQEVMLEVLLDIRDLLANPVVEISHAKED